MHRSAPAHCFVWYSTAQGIPQHPTGSYSPGHLTAHILEHPTDHSIPQHLISHRILQHLTAFHS